MLPGHYGKFLATILWLDMSTSSGCGYAVIDDGNIQFAIKEEEDKCVKQVNNDFEKIMNEFEQLASVLQTKDIGKDIQQQGQDQNESNEGNYDVKQLKDFESIAYAYESKVSKEEEKREEEYYDDEESKLVNVNVASCTDDDKIATQLKEFEYFAKSYEKKSEPKQKRFLLSADERKRKRRERDRKKNYTKRNCKICGQEFNNYQHCLFHVKKVHEGIFGKCPYCEYTNVRNSNVRVHIEQEHLKKTYDCNECDYKNKRKSNLKRHIISIHREKKINCDACNFTCKTNVSLKIHKNVEHKGINYPCEKCPYKAKITRNLRQHMARVHDKIRNFVCDLCSYRCGSNRDLRNHKQGKHEGGFPCDSCAFVCTTKDGLRKHKALKHLVTLKASKE